MKKITAMLILFVTTLFVCAASAEMQIVAYEKMHRYNYDEKEFRVIARAIEGELFGERAWTWYVKDKEGFFRSVDGGYGWVIQEYEYEKLPEEQREAIESDKEFVLTINRLADNFYVKSFEEYVRDVRSAGTDDEAAMVVCCAFVGACAIALVALIYRSRLKKKSEIEYYGSEEKLREAEREAEIIKWEKRELERQRLEKARTIVKTRIIDSYGCTRTTGRTSTSSAIGRGVVGGMIAGPLGAVVGASTAKKKYTTREYRTVVFKVWYADGHEETKNVAQGSADYKKYIEKIED